MSAEQATLDGFATGLPRRVNGWELADDRDGHRHLPNSPLGSRVYWEGDREGDTIVLVVLTDTGSISIHTAGWCAGDDALHKERADRDAIDAAIELMRDTAPTEVE